MIDSILEKITKQNISLETIAYAAIMKILEKNDPSPE